MSKKDAPATLDDYEFNHALYHHLGHWAAYVAMMALLATFGLLIAVSQPPSQPLGLFDLWIRGVAALGVLIVVAGFAVFFTTGMDRYGGLLHGKLGEKYLAYTLYWKHQRMIRSARLAAIAGASCDAVLLILVALQYPR